MANVKISDLTAYVDPASSDILPIVDLVNDVTKKVTIADLLENAGDGSAAAPAFAFNSDSNTGIYRSGADELSFATGGTQRLVIDSSGNVSVGGSNVVTVGDTGTVTSAMILDGTIVNADINASAAIAGTKISPDFGSQNVLTTGSLGVGTTSPSNNLDILSTTSGATVNARVGSTAASGVNNANLIINNGGTGNATLRFDYESSTNRASIGVPQSTEALFFTTAGSERMRIDSSGNAIFKNSNYVSFNDNGYIRTDSSGYLRLQMGSNGTMFTNSSNTEVARLDSSGRLLVGTSSSPTAGSGAIAKSVIQGNTSNSAGAGYLSLQRGQAAASISSGETLGLINFADSAGNDYAIIKGRTGAAGGSNDYPGELVFGTAADGASVTTDRMIIDSSGKVGINQTSPTAFIHAKSGANDGTVIGTFEGATNNKLDIKFNSGGPALNVTAGDPLAFEIGGTERMRIDSSGNVGVGVTNPQTGLHISDGSSLAGPQTTGAGRLTIQNSSSADIQLMSANTGYNHIFFGDQDDANAGVIYYQHNSGVNAMVFTTNAAERMRLDSSGRLLVGTSSVIGAGNDLLVLKGTAATDASFYLGRNANASTISNGNGLGYIKFGGGDGGEAARIAGIADGTWSSTSDCPGRLVFSTTADGASSPTERMRIDSSGTTTFIKTVNNTAELLFGYGSSSGIYAGIGGQNNFNTNQLCDLLFYTNGSTGSRSPSERMRIDSSGRVGIGTTSPSSLLHLSANFGAAILTLADPANGMTGKISADTTTLSIGTITNHAVMLYANSTERARIDSSGRLLVGASSSSQVNTAVFQGNSAGGSGPGVILASSINNPSSTQVLGKLAFSDNGHVDAASIKAARDQGTWTSGSSQPSSLAFFTTADGSSSPTERMRIDSSGDFMVGQTNGSSGTQGIVCNANGLLSVCTTNTTTSIFNQNSTSGTRNLIVFRTDGTDRGSITSNGSSTSYNTTSDYRLKENIIDLDGAITRVKQLLPKRFNFIADDTTTVDGFLAHETQTVVPEAVTGEKDGEEMQGIDQSKLVPLLTAALQEAIAKIETLEQRLSDAGIA